MLHVLDQYPLVRQLDKSGTGLDINQWLTQHGFRAPDNLSSSNMLALLGMAVSGLGLTYLAGSVWCRC